MPNSRSALAAVRNDAGMSESEPPALDATPEEPAAGEPAAKPERRVRRWLLTWLRRLGVGIVVLVVAVTVASLVFNWVTKPPRALEPGFGSYLRVGSADVHYQHWGDHGSPIVLVPGAMESSIIWSAVGPLLGAHHRVYALDMAWHGYTRDPGSLTLAGQSAVLAGFIAALRLKRPLLVGHSLGAAVIAKVALEQPDRVGGVVFADGDGLPIGSGSWIGDTFRELLTHTPYLTSIIRIGERWPSAAHAAIKSLCASRCPGLTRRLAEQWVRPLGQQSEVDAIHRWLLGGSYGLPSRRIAALTVPSEVIWGSHDKIGGSLSATIANLHHPPVHIIKNADHLTMLAAPGAFASAVEAVPRRTASRDL